jgi:hypothetical protein
MARRITSATAIQSKRFTGGGYSAGPSIHLDGSGA